MKILTKTALIAGLSLATIAGNFSAASADDWDYDPYWRHGGWDNGWHHYDRDDYRRERRRDRNNAIAAGVLGLAAGAIIAGALSQPQRQPVYRQPVYNAPPAPVYYPAAPARRTYGRNYAGSFQPWTREWYNWCSRRYRSFNAQSGTYRGYDGQDHFCVAN
ncbi:BA14K family protein [Pseudochrobactrum sp. HB0163]|uniref:BA14K family protein n=1 Tax=Pseudochrobactrum sp. HB0163 TaxID=3450708 RepID=UPI003F6E057F